MNNDNILHAEPKHVGASGTLFEAQTLGYLRAADLPLGLLLNFNATRMTDGIKRVLNTRWSRFPRP